MKQVKTLDEILKDLTLNVEQKEKELKQYICPFIKYNGFDVLCSNEGYCYHKLNNYLCNAKSMVSVGK